MLIIKLQAESNGAHRNQTTSHNITPPDGWAVVTPNIENTAIQYLPFINIDSISNGVITVVSQGAIPEIPVSVSPQTPEERIAELEQKDIDNKLALAELYEMILNGGTV
ncbi:MAG: hypothetical protein VB118_00150 [Oscillospiraceae bacterium]|nr:hypothetical protein [Oscillospiraceae bacterium]